MRRAVLCCLCAGLSGIPALVAHAVAPTATVSFTVKLRGRAEPQHGAPHGAPRGKGTARIAFPSSHRLCYTIHVSGIRLPARAAELHVQSSKKIGRRIAPLRPPDKSGVSHGCIQMTPGQIKAIEAHPTYYYINVYTSDYPRGAVRGTL